MYKINDIYYILKEIIADNTETPGMLRPSYGLKRYNIDKPICRQISQEINEQFGIDINPTPNDTIATLFGRITTQLAERGQIDKTTPINRTLSMYLNVSADTNHQPLNPKQWKWTTNRIYSAVLSYLFRSMNRRVNRLETIGHFLYEADFDKTGTKTENLVSALRQIERMYRIKIYADYTIDDVVNVAQCSLIRRGQLSRQDIEIHQNILENPGIVIAPQNKIR